MRLALMCKYKLSQRSVFKVQRLHATVTKLQAAHVQQQQLVCKSAHKHVSQLQLTCMEHKL